MERLAWISVIAEPAVLLAMAVVAGVPLLLLPGPIDLVLAAAVTLVSIWLDHRLAESVRRLPVRVGLESMMGQSAVVVEPLDPCGMVKCGGELWRAVERHGRHVRSDERVRVAGARGLELQVELSLLQ